ncbi:MAG TPA: hypothetical protein VGD87_16055 [Archangium sp.]
MSEALQVKGFAWLNLLTYVKVKWGDGTFAELVAAFPGEKERFDAAHVSPVSWVPAALHMAVIEWVVRHKMDGTLESARVLGRELAERNLSGTFRSLTRLEDLKLALTSTERAFAQFYSLGKIKLTLSGGTLDANLADFPGATPTFGNVLGSGLVAFLRAGHIDATLGNVTVGPTTISYQVKVSLPAH